MKAEQRSSDHPLEPSHRQCRRCGVCCCKGGPALHLEDREQVESGKIPLKCLFTIRQGEPAYDNIRGVIAPAATDIIKIKGAAENDATCRFLNQEQVGCRIYDMRPVECRCLTCWDTRAITALYDKNRLTRSHLLSRLPGLSDLVAEHQAHCDYQRVAQWAELIRKDGRLQEAAEELLAIIRYDHSLRNVTVERTRLDPDLLEFLFGRPLSATIRMFKVKLLKNEAETNIVPFFL
ncbi:MAG: YkgJ family cysteine cluster protein [Desulfobacteraceae bacterium]|nr:MAG: YkgJ family cysteine cluster protein [Desulfobacteraceae bacterium]